MIAAVWILALAIGIAFALLVALERASTQLAYAFAVALIGVWIVLSLHHERGRS